MSSMKHEFISVLQKNLQPKQERQVCATCRHQPTDTHTHAYTQSSTDRHPPTGKHTHAHRKDKYALLAMAKQWMIDGTNFTSLSSYAQLLTGEFRRKVCTRKLASPDQKTLIKVEYRADLHRGAVCFT